MSSVAMQHSHQIDEVSASILAISASGWRLAPSQATSLCPQVAGRLTIVSGMAWVTMTGEDPVPELQPGDHFLTASQSLVVPAGSKLVMEAFSHAGQSAEPLVFEWSEETAAQGSRRMPAHVEAASGQGWKGLVVAPAKDLTRSLGESGMAFMRLVVGAVGMIGVALEPADRDISPREWSAR